MSPTIKEVLETAGKLPDKISIDNGYMSGENLMSIEENNLNAYIAVGHGEEETKENGKLIKEEFVYNKQEEKFECPGGRKLELKIETSEGKKP